MRITRIIAVTAVALWLGTPFVRSEDADESLRSQALALNNVTGDDAIKAKTIELVKDKAALRKLLSEAVGIAKETEKGKVDDKKSEEKKAGVKKADEKKDKDQPFNFNGALILAQAAGALRDYDSGEVFYKICIEHAVKLDDSEKLTIAYGGLIGLYERSKKYAEAYYVCEKLLDITEKDEDGLQELRPKIYDLMIEILAKQKKYEKAIGLCDECLEKYKPYVLTFVRRKADVYRDWGKTTEAIAELKKFQELMAESGHPRKDQYIEWAKYQLTSVYVDAGQPDKSIELLEELVKANPDVSTYQNDLGYILADNDKRLDEAERFVRKALEQDREKKKKRSKDDSDDAEESDDKDNPAYVDSLAWVFYKQKKYAEARDLLLEAVKSEDGQHVEIFDHLGDIYNGLGQKDDAVKTWQKALTLENQSLRDDARKVAIKKKIDANK